MLFFLAFSHSNYNSRLYNVLRGSISETDDLVFLRLRPKTYVPSTTTPSSTEVDEKSNSVEDKEQTNVDERDISDSGEEDHYFKWAALNRRPMESLAGRKRLAEMTLPVSRPGRINGGIWRSGIVG